MSDVEFYENNPFMLIREHWDDVPVNSSENYIKVPEGWNGLLREFAEDMKNDIFQHIPQEMCKHFFIVHPSISFGDLDFTASFTTSEIDKLFSDYRTKSAHTCAMCGSNDVTYIDTETLLPYCEKCSKSIGNEMETISSFYSY